jgi:hypothetical protein
MEQGSSLFGKTVWSNSTLISNQIHTFDQEWEASRNRIFGFCTVRARKTLNVINPQRSPPNGRQTAFETIILVEVFSKQ